MDLESYVASMVPQYIATALWAGLDTSREEGGNFPPLDENYGPDDVSAEALETIKKECRDFVQANMADLDNMDPGQAGHDFFLTRNGHGAGFWARDLGERGERLTKAAEAYGESDLYAGDDGELYV